MRVMNQPEWLKVGQIVGTHGIRGEVRVISRTDFPEERFSPGVRLMLRHPRLESPVPLTVERSRPHKRVLLIKFREWNNINDAEPYKGGELVVEGSEALDLDEGEYYFYQIIGCEVVHHRRGAGRRGGRHPPAARQRCVGGPTGWRRPGHPDPLHR